MNKPGEFEINAGFFNSIVYIHGKHFDKGAFRNGCSDDYHLISLSKIYSNINSKK